MKITLELESGIPLDIIVANFPKRLFVTDTSQPKIRPTGGSSSSHPMGIVAITKVAAMGCSYNHDTLRSKSDRSACPECGEDVTLRLEPHAAPK